MVDSPGIIRAEKVCKRFQQPDKSDLTVLQQLDFSLGKGEMAVITGVSGSGKSTFLHLLGGLDHPDSGSVVFAGKDISGLKTRELAEYRNQKIGFVFQFHYLMPELSVLENTAFPALMNAFDRQGAYRKAEHLLDQVGLGDKLQNMPYQLSGGERQRVAIARSLINDPHLLLADEPTGNIDYKTGAKVFDLFRQLIDDRSLSCVLVTHNEGFAKTAKKSYRLKEGRLFNS